MTNGQYIIPTTPESSADDTRQPIEVVSTTPEAVVNVFSSMKNIERRIEQFRAAATENDLPRSVKLRVLELFTATPRSLEERLVEQESIIGGTIFSQDNSVLRQRFWYHRGDWFFERATSDTRHVIRYQLTETSVHKLIEGREHDFNDGEVEVLFTAIDHYHNRVQYELYPSQSDVELAA